MALSVRRRAGKVGSTTAVEDVLDALLPRLPDGIHERALPDGSVQLAAHPLTAALPPLEELAAVAGPALLEIGEEEVPDDWRERRRLAGGGVLIGGCIWLRTPLDPPGPQDHLELVIERAGAFGAGTHPTTRLCLALLLTLPAAGGFADLGCGAGTLAIAVARLGFDPVVGVDASPGAVAATAANAARNAAMVRTEVVNLLSERPPAAPVAAANVPLALHASLAPALPDGLHTLIASGVGEEDARALAATYEPAGLHLREGRAEGAWVALRLERA